MLKARADAVAAQVAQFKRLPAALRVMYAEKVIDAVVLLLVDIAAALDDLKKEG